MNQQLTTVFTIGTSTREIDGFLSLLKDHQIERLIDVRSFPTSKFEHFRWENLKAYVETAGIEYFYLGDYLGGYRKGGYQSYMETAKFQEGIKCLVQLIAEKPTALMCCERFPWRCHRRFISMRLQNMGWQVIHIIDKGHLWIPKRQSPQNRLLTM